MFNPFSFNLVYENHPDGFILPYKLAGKVDIEIIKSRYNKLNNNSYGCIVRLNSQLR